MKGDNALAGRQDFAINTYQPRDYKRECVGNEVKREDVDIAGDKRCGERRTEAARSSHK